MPDAPTAVVSRERVVGGPPPPPVPPERQFGLGLLLGLVALLLVGGGIAAAWFVTHRSDSSATKTVVVTSTAGPTGARKVLVPRVVGLKQEQAVARLTQAGLEPKTVLRPANGKPAGVVVSQRPLEATKLARGDQVTLVISSGAAEVTVPDVHGSSLADARTKLDALGLRTVAKQVESTQRPGTVVDQSPAAGGNVRRGAAVTLSVAKAASTVPNGSTAPRSTTTKSASTSTAAAPPPPPAPRTASVPDVTSSSLQDAVHELTGAGFLASIQYVPGEDPLGTVVAQSPSGDSSAKTRSHVTINASSGPGQKTQETVPDVTGQTLTQAVSTLNGAHLRLIFAKVPVTDRTQAGKIVEQTPRAGTQAPENAQVLVYLGAFRQP